MHMTTTGSGAPVTNRRAPLSAVLRVAVPFLLVLPSVTLLVVILVLPLLRSISVSLTNADLAEPAETWRFVGLDNFAWALGNRGFRHAVWNNVLFMLISVPVQIAAALGIALLLNSRKVLYPGLVRTLILFPMFVSQVAASYNWKWLFIDVYGLLNYLLSLVSLGPVSWLSASMAFTSVLIADFWRDVPFALIICLAGLAGIPDDLYDAADVDGANRWQAFVHITLPLLRSTILVILLIRSMDALRMFDMVQVLTGGGPAAATEMISTYVYRTTFEGMRLGRGAAMAILQWVIILAFGLIYIRLFQRGGSR